MSIAKKYIDLQTSNSLSSCMDTFPFPVAVLPGFLERQAFEDFRTECLETWHPEADSIRGRQYGVVGSNKIARFFFGKEFKQFLGNLTQRKWARGPNCYPQLRTASNRDPGSPIHTDAGLPYNAAIFLHLTNNWVVGDGGELCLWKKGNNGQFENVRTVNPVENTLVVMLFSAASFHSVKPYDGLNSRTTLLTEWCAGVR